MRDRRGESARSAQIGLFALQRYFNFRKTVAIVAGEAAFVSNAIADDIPMTGDDDGKLQS
jgi:hypothetical protein